ncbi:MAG: entericidin A/B family lipoprotein [Planctomycetota bacterium]|jgi:predicted small secreted protein
MIKKILLPVILFVVVFIIIGCNTAEGLKGDAIFIGNKTTEVLDK